MVILCWRQVQLSTESGPLEPKVDLGRQAESQQTQGWEKGPHSRLGAHSLPCGQVKMHRKPTLPLFMLFSDFLFSLPFLLFLSPPSQTPQVLWSFVGLKSYDPYVVWSSPFPSNFSSSASQALAA